MRTHRHLSTPIDDGVKARPLVIVVALIALLVSHGGTAATAQARPNIVVIMTDDQRRSSCG